MAPRLRPSDILEIQKATGWEPEYVLRSALKLRGENFTFRTSPKERPFCLFGVAEDEHDEDAGVIWFVGTPDIQKHSFALLHEAPFWLAHWHKKYPVLHNAIYAANTAALRWVHLLGFESYAHITLNGHPFIHIRREGSQ